MSNAEKETEADSEDGTSESGTVDPRVALVQWANDKDEWLRLIVGEVLKSGRALSDSNIEDVYLLFRQEKGLDAREISKVSVIAAPDDETDTELPLTITRLSKVQGVNALVSGSTVEPDEGLTILYGENGTGKTGYSRIFKALAGSRTAVEILGDINLETQPAQSARIDFEVGTTSNSMTWSGETGTSPFTRISVFDSPAVNYHVDDDLEYVYTPSVMALYNNIVAGIKGVQTLIGKRVTELSKTSTVLLGRFPRESSVYPAIETLGSSTDLDELKKGANNDGAASEEIKTLQRSIAALEANTVGASIKLREREARILSQAGSAFAIIDSFDIKKYNNAIGKQEDLRKDHAQFRQSLFKSANLPAEADETWERFVASGDEYRQHLEASDAHDDLHCLYCRQLLETSALQLIEKYGEFLADKIRRDIETESATITKLTEGIRSTVIAEIEPFIDEFDGSDDPDYVTALRQLISCNFTLQDAITQNVSIDTTTAEIAQSQKLAGDAASSTGTTLEDLREQDENRESALVAKNVELVELKAAVELGVSWPQIEQQVANAKETDRLGLLAKALPKLSRNATDLAKVASDQLMNNNFDRLFLEECASLRAPKLRLQFIGKQGKAKRRKLLNGEYRPSKILSEGEQKVLAIADFLAEARLAGISAPVIFDDPVSSLDHRRINEVAERIAALADHTQVIVFTHDILFATKLLSLFEVSKRCTYYLVSDEDGKGHISKATGQSWESLSGYKRKINKTIQDANAATGEIRVAHVRSAYSWIRSWCEVFVEKELLQGVSERYQPNVRMGALERIKADALTEAIPTVTQIFNEACRHIPGHSHPLPTHGVAPTLQELEDHWKELQECRNKFLAA